MIMFFTAISPDTKDSFIASDKTFPLAANGDAPIRPPMWIGSNLSELEPPSKFTDIKVPSLPTTLALSIETLVSLSLPTRPPTYCALLLAA